MGVRLGQERNVGDWTAGSGKEGTYVPCDLQLGWAALPPQFLWDRGHVGMGVKCLNAVYRAL